MACFAYLPILGKQGKSFLYIHSSEWRFFIINETIFGIA